MTWLSSVFILLTAFLAVFWEAAFPGVRYLLGAQVDLLPSLIVYAGLRTGLGTVTLTALMGGCWFDSLSANPLGVTVLPLFLCGFGVFLQRELILRDEVFAQAVLGLAASAACPVLTVLLLLTKGHAPLIGWGSLWQLAVMSIGGAVVTPVFFIFFEWLHRAFEHSRPVETSFRPDREIRRGRL